MENYDEDLNENLWYTTLCEKYEDLFFRVTSERWMICVPCTGSWKNFEQDDELFAQKYFESHILKQAVLYTPDGASEQTDVNGSNKYLTFNGKEVYINGSTIRCGSGFVNKSHKPSYNREHDQLELHMEACHSSQILFEETFFNQNDESYIALCLSQPLEASLVLLSSDEETTKKAEVSSVYGLRWEEHGDLVWTNAVNGARVKQQIDAVVVQYITEQDAQPMYARRTSTEKDLKKLLASNSEHILSLLRNCLQIAAKDAKLKKMMETEIQMDKLKSSIEGYVLHRIYDVTMNNLNNNVSVEESVLNKLTRRLSSITLSDLGVKPIFWAPAPRARRELSRLNELHTPCQKMICLKRTVSFLFSCAGSSSADEAMSSDDLLPLLVYLVVKSDVANWLANILYLKLHRAICDKDQLSFYLATLEAAVSHIKNGNVKVDLFHTASNSHHQGNDQEQLDKLFQCVRDGNASGVDMLLRHNESIRVLQEYDKCHPLCECSKCHKLTERKARSGHSHVITTSTRDDKGRTALHVAALAGRHEVVDALMNHNADVAATDYHGLTPLHLAAQEGSQGVIFILLHFGSDAASTDNNNNTPLHLACLNGHEGCVKALLYYDPTSTVVKIDAENDLGDTPLHLASRWGFVGIAHALMEYGANARRPNRRKLTPLDVARDWYVAGVLKTTEICQRYEDRMIPSPQQQPSRQPKQSPDGKPQAAKSLNSRPETRVEKTLRFFRPQDEKVNTEKEVKRLFSAIVDNDINMVAFLCGWKPPQDPSAVGPAKCHPLCQCHKCAPRSRDCPLHASTVSADGTFPLHEAARLGLADMCELLVSNRAKVDARSRRGHFTALHLAAQYGHASVVSLLLSSGAAFDGRDGEGNTPVFMCARNGHSECTRLLIERGCSINIRNRKGNSPLHEAVRWKNGDIVRMLVERGAMVYYKNNDGVTSIDLASKDEELMAEVTEAWRVQKKRKEEGDEQVGEGEDEQLRSLGDESIADDLLRRFQPRSPTPPLDRVPSPPMTSSPTDRAPSPPSSTTSSPTDRTPSQPPSITSSPTDRVPSPPMTSSPTDRVPSPPMTSSPTDRVPSPPPSMTSSPTCNEDDATCSKEAVISVNDVVAESDDDVSIRRGDDVTRFPPVVGPPCKSDVTFPPCDATAAESTENNDVTNPVDSHVDDVTPSMTTSIDSNRSESYFEFSIAKKESDRRDECDVTSDEIDDDDDALPTSSVAEPSYLSLTKSDEA